MSDGLDRNLLLGAVALHLNLISREQLVAGINGWANNVHCTLADVLEQSGVLSAESLQRLEPLIEQHVLVHDSEGSLNLATLPLAPRVPPESHAGRQQS